MVLLTKTFWSIVFFWVFLIFWLGVTFCNFLCNYFFQKKSWLKREKISVCVCGVLTPRRQWKCPVGSAFEGFTQLWPAFFVWKTLRGWSSRRVWRAWWSRRAAHVILLAPIVLVSVLISRTFLLLLILLIDYTL